jgi:hypothetical protein
MDDVVRVLRHDAPIDPRLDGRIMAAVRTLPRHRHLGVLSRLTLPRSVMVTPLSWGLLAASALLFAAGAGAMVSVAVHAHAARRVAATDTTKSVTLAVVAPNASKVAVVGDFNGWDPSHPSYQARNQGGGVWTATFSVPLGPHQYSFVVDDSLWIADPTAPRVIDNDFGIPKSAMIVSADR